MLSRLRSLFRPSIEPDPPRVRDEPRLAVSEKKKMDWGRVAPSVGAPPLRDVFKPYTPPPGVQGCGQSALAMDSGAATGATLMNWIGEAISEGVVFLGYPRLAEMAQRAEYRNMVEILATESTREWIDFQAVGKDDKGQRIDQLRNEFIRLKVRERFRGMSEMDGYYGLGLLYVDVGQARTSDIVSTPLPLRPETFRKGSLKELVAVDPIWAAPNQYSTSTPLASDFYKPSTWWVQGANVHHTRLLRFVSRDVPDILKPTYNFGGLSLAQMAKPYVDNWLRTRQSVSDLINAFSVVALSTNMTSYQQDPEGLLARVEAFNRFRSNRGTFLLDKDSEEIQILNAALAGLDKLQAQAQEQMCSVAQTPLVKFTGITPSGLNASSDGEIRVFYDRVHAYQENTFREPLTAIMHMCMLNLWGEIDPGITFEFNTLWQATDEEAAAIEKTKADIDAEYIDRGVISNSEARDRIAADPESIYQGVVERGSEAPEVPDEGDNLS